MKTVQVTDEFLIFTWECAQCGEPGVVRVLKTFLGGLLLYELGLGPPVANPYRPYSKTGNVVYKEVKDSDILLRSCCYKCSAEVEFCLGQLEIVKS